jgi:hypothetical protein
VGDGLAGGKRAVTGPVCQGPLPSLQLQLPASASPMECSADSGAALLRARGIGLIITLRRCATRSPRPLEVSHRTGRDTGANAESVNHLGKSRRIFSGP